MPAMEVGRICVKVSGREAGKKCVIIDLSDKSFVLITGPKKITGVRRRRVNANHIEPLEDKIDVKRGATDDEVTKELEASKKTDMMKEEIKLELAKI